MSYRTAACRLVLARESNVVRVDFKRDPEPPAPSFPGAGALRAPPANDEHVTLHDTFAA